MFFRPDNTWVEIDETLEATVTGAMRVRFIAQSSNITFWIDDFTVYEVSPACIDNNQLAFDGWFKANGTDVYRQGNDEGTLTKDGSYYSLYMDYSTAGDYVQWPLVANRSEPHLTLR